MFDSLCVRRLGLVRLHAHELAILRALFLELDMPIGFCIERVVPADTDIDARVETSAALAHDDVAREYLLAAEDLDA